MPRRRRDEPAHLPESINSTVSLDDIYSIINYVQIARESISFKALPDDAIVMQTILKDTNVGFDAKELKAVVKFTLTPPPEKDPTEDMIDFEEDDYEDELVEEGQCF